MLLLLLHSLDNPRYHQEIQTLLFLHAHDRVPAGPTALVGLVAPADAGAIDSTRMIAFNAHYH